MGHTIKMHFLSSSKSLSQSKKPSAFLGAGQEPRVLIKYYLKNYTQLACHILPKLWDGWTLPKQVHEGANLLLHLLHRGECFLSILCNVWRVMLSLRSILKWVSANLLQVKVLLIDLTALSNCHQYINYRDPSPKCGEYDRYCPGPLNKKEKLLR